MSKRDFHLDGPDGTRTSTPSSSRVDLSHRSTGPNSGPRRDDNERTSLLSVKPNDDAPPKRSYTVEMDAAELEGEGRAPAGAEDGSKTDLASVDEGDMSDGGQRGTPKRKKRSVAATVRQRAKYYVPVTEWLPNYNWALFSGDLVAGISMACLLIPQGMSYASGLAKISPLAGLWSTAIPALLYAVLGTCRQLSVGPEAALALLIGQMIQEVVYGDPHSTPENPELEAAAIALITTFQVGLITTGLGLLRLGFLDVVLSRALLRGFITAAAIIIFIEQLVPMLGLTYVLAHPPLGVPKPSLPIDKLAFIIQYLPEANRATAILSFSSLAILIVARSLKARVVNRPGGTWVKYVSEIFLIVAGTTVLTGLLRWDQLGVEVLGQVKGGSAVPFGWPLDKRRLRYFGYTFPTAAVSAVIGIVDSVVAARENGGKYGYAVGPNRELVALGTANLAASSLVGTGCVPIFGSLTRSRLNGSTGARTQMSAIITSIVIILSIFFLLPYLYFLPKATLAAIIVLVVYAILAEAPHEILYFWRVRAWTDFLQMTGTFFLTLFFSIETGLVASVVFSLILVIQKSTQTRIKIIGRLPGTDEWVPIDEDEAAQEDVPGVLVVRVRENLNFANTGQLKERLRRLELYGMQKSHPSDAPRRESAKSLILHMGDVEEIDASAIQILYELSKAYQERGTGVHFAHLREAHYRLFEIAGISDLCGPSHFHRDLRSAMHEIESLGYGTSITDQFPI